MINEPFLSLHLENFNSFFQSQKSTKGDQINLKRNAKSNIGGNASHSLNCIWTDPLHESDPDQMSINYDFRDEDQYYVIILTPTLAV